MSVSDRLGLSGTELQAFSAPPKGDFLEKSLKDLLDSPSFSPLVGNDFSSLSSRALVSASSKILVYAAKHALLDVELQSLLEGDIHAHPNTIDILVRWYTSFGERLRSLLTMQSTSAGVGSLSSTALPEKGGLDNRIASPALELPFRWRLDYFSTSSHHSSRVGPLFRLCLGNREFVCTPEQMRDFASKLHSALRVDLSDFDQPSAHDDVED